MENKLYKNKYVIGIYNCEQYDDSLIALLNNSREFADFLGITIYHASTTLKQVYDKAIHNIIYRGKKCEICLLDLNGSD